MIRKVLILLILIQGEHVMFSQSMDVGFSVGTSQLKTSFQPFADTPTFHTYSNHLLAYEISGRYNKEISEITKWYSTVGLRRDGFRYRVHDYNDQLVQSIFKMHSLVLGSGLSFNIEKMAETKRKRRRRRKKEKKETNISLGMQLYMPLDKSYSYNQISQAGYFIESERKIFFGYNAGIERAFKEYKLKLQLTNTRFIGYDIARTNIIGYNIVLSKALSR